MQYFLFLTRQKVTYNDTNEIQELILEVAAAVHFAPRAHQPTTSTKSYKINKIFIPYLLP